MWRGAGFREELLHGGILETPCLWAICLELRSRSPSEERPSAVLAKKRLVCREITVEFPGVDRRFVNVPFGVCNVREGVDPGGPAVEKGSDGVLPGERWQRTNTTSNIARRNSFICALYCFAIELIPYMMEEVPSEEPFKLISGVILHNLRPIP